MDEIAPYTRPKADWFLFLGFSFFLFPLLIPWTDLIYWILHALALVASYIFWHDAFYFWDQIKKEDERIHREALNDIETNTEDVRISENLKQFSPEQIALFEKNAPGIEVMFGLPAPTLVLRVQEGKTIPYSFIDQHLRRGNRHYMFAWSNYTTEQDQKWGKLFGEFFCLWKLASNPAGNESYKWLDYETAMTGVYAGGRIRPLVEEMYQVIEPSGSSDETSQEQESEGVYN